MVLLSLIYFHYFHWPKGFLKVTSCKNIGGWSWKGGNLVVLSLGLSLLKSEEKTSLSERILHKGYQAKRTSFPRGPSPQGSFTFFWFWLPDFILTQPSVQRQTLRKRALETTWQLTLYTLRQLWAYFLGPAAGASPEVPCKGWLLGLQPWALREQPFPLELACQTKLAANSHFKSVSIISEPPILSPLFG